MKKTNIDMVVSTKFTKLYFHIRCQPFIESEGQELEVEHSAFHDYIIFEVPLDLRTKLGGASMAEPRRVSVNRELMYKLHVMKHDFLEIANKNKIDIDGIRFEVFRVTTVLPKETEADKVEVIEEQEKVKVDGQLKKMREMGVRKYNNEKKKQQEDAKKKIGKLLKLPKSLVG